MFNCLPTFKSLNAIYISLVFEFFFLSDFSFSKGRSPVSYVVRDPGELKLSRLSICEVP